MSIILKSDRIDKIQKCLEELNQKNGNLGGFLCSEEGLVVISAKSRKNNDDYDALAAMGAALLGQINDYIFQDVIISNKNKKVYIRKLDGEKSNLIFINIFEYNKRYFRRELNNTIRKINKILKLL